MPGIILPPFIGAPEEAPTSSSGLLVYDEIWVREPRLMVPRSGAIGNCKFDLSHQYLRSFTSGPLAGYVNNTFFNLKTGNAVNGERNVSGIIAPMRGSGCGYGPYSYGYCYQKILTTATSYTAHSGFCLFEFVTSGGGTAHIFSAFDSANPERCMIAANASNELYIRHRSADSAALTTLIPGVYALSYVTNDTNHTVYLNGNKFTTTTATSGGDFLFGIAVASRYSSNVNQNICVTFGVTGLGLLPEQIAMQASISPLDCVIPA